MSDMMVPELSGRRVVLKTWRVEDAAWYVEARDDVIFEFTTESRDLTVEQAAEAIARARSSSDLVPFAIWTADGELVGNLAVSIRARSAEVSYFLAPAGRGRGYASDAVRTSVAWAMDNLDIDEVVACVALANADSTRVLLQAGFIEVGRSQHNELGETMDYSFRA